MLAFLDQIVIPFLTNLYGAIGYLGVLVASLIESAMVPLPSELILPFAGFMVVDPHSHWNFWIVVLVGVAGDLTGACFGYALGSKLGRPFLDRWGHFLLIRKHEIDRAESFFARWGAPTAFIGRLLPGVRSIIGFAAGVARMPFRTFIVFSALGVIPWTIGLVWAGTVMGSNWPQIREALRPFDTLILVAAVAAVLLFVWWRLGHPGWRRGETDDSAEPVDLGQ
jgi:membrane protein DedA with SNARE-associated domain